MTERNRALRRLAVPAVVALAVVAGLALRPGMVQSMGGQSVRSDETSSHQRVGFAPEPLRSAVVAVRVVVERSTRLVRTGPELGLGALTLLLLVLLFAVVSRPSRVSRLLARAEWSAPTRGPPRLVLR